MSGKPSIWTICSTCSEEPHDGCDEPDDTGQNAVLEMTYADGRLTVEKIIDPNGYLKGAG